jgi:hypothetical protein
VIEIANGVVINDVSRALLTHPKKAYKERSKTAKTLFVHHTGADNGRDNLEAWSATAGYHVINKGWPGIAYHFGINLRPSVDKKGRLVIYQLNRETTICYHTKGCNNTGVGLVLQGHHGEDTLSDFQIECLEAFLPWWFEVHGQRPKKQLGWHSISLLWGGVPKLACPGKYAVEWLRTWKLGSW